MHPAETVTGGVTPSHGVPALVVSKMLGHSSPSVTLGIYAHATLEMQDKAVDDMEEVVTPVLAQIPRQQAVITE